MSNWWQIDNLTFPVFRQYLNAALQRLLAHNAASELESDPDKLVAGQIMFVNAASEWYGRNAANDAFVKFGTENSLLTEINPPVGSRLLFQQDSVGTGWELQTTYTDRVPLIINSGSVGTSGSWVVGGLTNSHIHSVSIHITTGGPSATKLVGGGNDTTAPSTDHVHTGDVTVNTGAPSVTAISSNGAWRPANLQFKLFERTL